MNTVKKVAPWLASVFGALAIIYSVAVGGSTTQVFPGKDGAEYKVTVDIPEGVVDLVDKCGPEKMAVVGAICPAAASIIIETTKAPTKVTKAPEKSEPKPEPEKKADATIPNNVKEVKDPVKAKPEVKEGEVKVPVPTEGKKPETKPEGEGK